MHAACTEFCRFLPQDAFAVFGAIACISVPGYPFYPWLTAVLRLAPVQRGWTPLLIASQKGHLDVVKELVSKGAAVDKANHVHCEADFMWLRVMHVHLPLLGESQSKCC